MITISIIIPVYNVELYIEECLNSVIGQKYKNIEIILVDDGSTDHSGDICDKYASVDERIRVIHKKNGGLSEARNYGLEAATGDYVIFLDSDDYWSDDSVLTKVTRRIIGVDVVVFDLKKVPDGQDELSVPYISSLSGLRETFDSGKLFLEELLNVHPTYEWYAVKYAIRRELLMQTGIRFPLKKRYEDVATIYKVILEASRISIINEPLYIYRTRRKGAITGVESVAVFKELIQVDINAIQDVENRSDISPDLRKKLCSNFSAGYYAAVIRSMGCPKEDRKELWDFLQKNKWVCKYSRSEKQVFGRLMVIVLGVRLSAVILNLRRIMRERNQ